MQRVSIVIPCYNSGATINQTIDSAKAQTWGDVEIIVVDDGSCDPVTVATLDALSGIRLLRQPNAGLPAARNAGIAAATGDYVLPLDADDWLEPEAVAALLSTLQATPTATYAYSHMQLEGEAQGVLAKSYNFFEQLFLNQMPYSLLLPKDVWKKVGGYDETMHRGYEDWEFNIKLGIHGYFGVVVPRPLFHYRVTSGGMLLSRSNRLHGELWREIQDKHTSTYLAGNLIAVWRDWRNKPATYPLWMYFGWLFIHRLLPQASFSALFRYLRLHSHSRRVTNQVVNAFGEEWSRFPQHEMAESERQEIFDDYFSDFPWDDLPENSRGADIGCGSGRWATVAAPRVGWLTCVDASAAALEVARKNMAGQENVDFRQADVKQLPFADGELDFAYSLGVLHHVPDTTDALCSIARKLKPGGFLLLYLYYGFDNRPPWFRLLWRIADLMRRLICHLPSVLRFAVCDTIAVFVYWPLGRLAALLAKLGMQVGNFPLAYYKDKSFYVMRTDALDRFGTRLEKRFRRDQIAAMLENAGFENAQFSDTEPFWCAVARKCQG